MIIEMDRETMALKILKYVVVHDCGEVINPLILDGQIQGGVAQGIGDAFYEKLSFSEDGQMLSGSFMDYLIPTAMEIPRMEIGHVVTPSPLNPLGTKGAGEAGAIPVGPLFAQAIEDALEETGIEILENPVSPSKLWHLLNDAD
jgi:CO/xanthine dehydrogenase Mo-binding subunit